jgi:hypothetical protein
MKQQTLLEKTFHRKSQGELQPLLDNDQPKVDFALDEKIDKYSIVYWVRDIGGGKKWRNTHRYIRFISFMESHPYYRGTVLLFSPLKKIHA